MRRTTSIIVLTVFLATAGLTASVASAATTATAPRAMLTAFEYQTLSRYHVQLQDVLHSRKINWQAAFAACPASNATALLSVETADCAAGVAWLRALLVVVVAVKQEPTCARQAAQSALTCLLPSYESLAQTTDRAVGFDVQTKAVAAARGFTGACLATLATTSSELATERRLAQLLNETVASMRTMNGPALRQLGPQLTETMDALLRGAGPTNLAVCKHQ